MAISDAQFTAWLSDNTAIRCIIAEVNPVIATVSTLLKLSNKNYIDEVLNVTYDPILNSGSFRIAESISLSGSSSISFGDISIVNNDGSNDAWLSYVWSNTSVSVKVGDVRWLETDFRPVLIGSVEDIFSSNRNTLNLKIRDKLQRLNVEIIDTVLGGSTNNKNEILPLSFGETFNVSPLLTDPATLEYQVHDGPIESVVEVRDNGVPVANTPTVSTGKFTLTNQPFGFVTATIQGDKPSTYENNIRDIIQRMVTGYGESSLQFTTSDIDLTNFAAFEAANTQAVGVYINGRQNLLQACQELAWSVGASLVMNRLGELQLITIDAVGAGTPFAITTEHIVNDTLQIKSKLKVEASQKLAYVQNHTVQENLQTGIPADNKVIFGKRWQTVTVEDAAVKSAYKLTSDPVQKETALLNLTTATTEATRLLDLYKVPRFVYKFKGTPALIDLKLGDAVTLTHPRFELAGGKAGMVIGISISWDDFTVSMEVLA